MIVHQRVMWLVVLSLLVLSTVVGTAFAHSGGTDSCGGHTNHKTGQYHVHNWAKYNACHPPQSSASSTTPATEAMADAAFSDPLLKLDIADLASLRLQLMKLMNDLDVVLCAAYNSGNRDIVLTELILGGEVVCDSP